MDNPAWKITRAEVLMGRDQEFPLDVTLQKNLDALLVALNKLREDYGKPMNVTSGYRPGHYNTDAGGAKASSHLTCQACDFADPEGRLDSWCMSNLDKLTKYGLWLEGPAYTPGWCHLQIRPVPGARVFQR